MSDKRQERARLHLLDSEGEPPLDLDFHDIVDRMAAFAAEECAALEEARDEKTASLVLAIERNGAKMVKAAEARLAASESERPEAPPAEGSVREAFYTFAAHVGEGKAKGRQGLEDCVDVCLAALPGVEDYMVLQARCLTLRRERDEAIRRRVGTVDKLLRAKAVRLTMVERDALREALRICRRDKTDLEGLTGTGHTRCKCGRLRGYAYICDHCGEDS